MNLKSWGNYPKFKSSKVIHSVTSIKDELISKTEMIAQGNHRSYGDSAFAKVVINMTKHDLFLNFDIENGIIQCQSGVLFKDILEVCIPKGWLIPVLPGTQYITLGGAIASDVHGKNHHQVGTISNFIDSLSLLQADGSIINCSKTKHKDLFHATFGGMGLTGIILDAKLKLTKIQSNSIQQQIIKTNTLKQTLSVFEDNLNSTYCVAWFDCLSKEVGKSVISLGTHTSATTKSPLQYTFKQKLTIPFYFPGFILNKWSIKIFNWLYYRKARELTKTVPLQQFFFPLDTIAEWNKIYGKKGFIQYQCVIPLKNSEVGIKQIMEKIQSSGQGSFLAVLKRMGDENNNFLSFPMQGYTLALDFKVNKKVINLLNTLDEIVLEHKGRVYLCKDSRVSKQCIQKSYSKLEKFKSLRVKYKLNKVFNSQQSKRLDL